MCIYAILAVPLPNPLYRSSSSCVSTPSWLYLFLTPYTAAYAILAVDLFLTPYTTPTPQLIFMCIYAILAVDLFHGFGSMDGTYMTSDIVPMLDGSDLLLNTSVTSLTSRGMHHFSEYYGTFFRALYTLFQVSSYTNHCVPSRMCASRLMCVSSLMYVC